MKINELLIEETLEEGMKEKLAAFFVASVVALTSGNAAAVFDDVPGVAEHNRARDLYWEWLRSQPKLEKDPKYQAELKKKAEKESEKVKKIIANTKEQERYSQELIKQNEKFLRDKEDSRKTKISVDAIKRIEQKVHANVIAPPGIQGNPSIKVSVKISNNEIIDYSIVRGSGNQQLDQAILRAVAKSSPVSDADGEFEINVKPFSE